MTMAKVQINIKEILKFPAQDSDKISQLAMAKFSNNLLPEGIF